MDFSARLKKARIKAGLTQQKMAEAIGMGYRMYTLYEKGEYEGEPSRIQKYMGKLEQIEAGNLPASISPNAKEINIEHSRFNMYMVPVKAQGGFFKGYEDATYLDSLEKYPFPFVRGKCFAFEVEGFSMVNEDDPRGSYYPGDWVVCTQIESFSWLTRNKVYVFVTIDGICIKQFEKIESNKIYLKSLNRSKDYEVKPIPIKEVKMAMHIEKRMI